FAEKRKDLREELTELLKITISRKEHKNLYYPVQIASELVGNETENPYLFALLIGASMDYQETENWMIQKDEDRTTSINGLVTSGLNTIYGAAIEALTHIKDTYCQNSLFETVESILSSGPADARAILYFRLAYLTHLDVEKTNEI